MVDVAVDLVDVAIDVGVGGDDVGGGEGRVGDDVLDDGDDGYIDDDRDIDDDVVDGIEVDVDIGGGRELKTICYLNNVSNQHHAERSLMNAITHHGGLIPLQRYRRSVGVYHDIIVIFITIGLDCGNDNRQGVDEFCVI